MDDFDMFRDIIIVVLLGPRAFPFIVPESGQSGVIQQNRQRMTGTQFVNYFE
jgi:hypothetical protein